MENRSVFISPSLKYLSLSWAWAVLTERCAIHNDYSRSENVKGAVLMPQAASPLVYRPWSSWPVLPVPTRVQTPRSVSVVRKDSCGACAWMEPTVMASDYPAPLWLSQILMMPTNSNSFAGSFHQQHQSKILQREIVWCSVPCLFPAQSLLPTATLCLWHLRCQLPGKELKCWASCCICLHAALYCSQFPVS